jgi:hypothetical protein
MKIGSAELYKETGEQGERPSGRVHGSPPSRLAGVYQRQAAPARSVRSRGLQSFSLLPSSCAPRPRSLWSESQVPIEPSLQLQLRFLAAVSNGADLN